MHQRRWLTFDESDPRKFASALRCVQRYLSDHGFCRGDSKSGPVRKPEAIREARIRYLQCLIDNESLPPKQQLRIVDLDESYVLLQCVIVASRARRKRESVCAL